MSINQSPLKIAVLINGFESPRTPGVQASFISAITSASSLAGLPFPAIDFFDPIVAQIHPEPSKYDLIVLSGGTADPMGSLPWVLKLQDFLRTTVKEHPKQKIAGICWGHQTISVTFGGSVGNMDGPEIGVTQITLTAGGKRLFPFAVDGHLRMHEFHRREIKVPANGFVPLAEGNQSFVNETNTIMTFQGHPELNQDLAKIMLANTPTYMGVGEMEKEKLATNMESSQDGVKIWGRILEWIKE